MRFSRKYLFLTVALIYAHFIAVCQNSDSLKIALKNAKHDTTRCRILNVMVETEGDNAIWPVYNEQLKSLAEKNLSTGKAFSNIYLKYLASALINLGYIANQKGDIQGSLVFYNKSLRIQEEIDDQRGMSLSLNNIGDTYFQLGDILKALDYFHKSLKIREQINDKWGVAYSLNNIGIVYDKQNDESKALIYYLKSLKLMEAMGEKNGIALVLNNIGTVYNNQNDFPKGLEYYHKSLKIRQEMGDKHGIAYALNNIGNIYGKQGDLKKALDHFQESLKLMEEIDHKEGMAYSLSSLASLLLKMGKPNDALGFAKKGLQTANEIGIPQNIKNSASTLKLIYKAQNQYKAAFETYELEIKMRDSVNNQTTQKAAIKKQMQYTFEKKELEAKADQDKKDAVAKAELKQKENERNYFIAGFVLVAILALFILRGYKQKQKANAIILEQKHLVDEKQKEILDSIHYAKRIQMALLPNEKYIDKFFKQMRNS